MSGDESRPPLPPIDPDLLARLEAARDADGVIRDAALADEYFAALQQQGEQIRAEQAQSTDRSDDE